MMDSHLYQHQMQRQQQMIQVSLVQCRAAYDGFSPVPAPDAETAADDSGQSCPMQSCICSQLIQYCQFYTGSDVHVTGACIIQQLHMQCAFLMHSGPEDICQCDVFFVCLFFFSSSSSSSCFFGGVGEGGVFFVWSFLMVGAWRDGW